MAFGDYVYMVRLWLKTFILYTSLFFYNGNDEEKMINAL